MIGVPCRVTDPEIKDVQRADVLAGRIALEDLKTQPYDIFSHQNADIVRLTPEQLKARMAAKDAAAKSAAD